MWDHTLSMNERITDLISRLTLEEKVAQMLNAAPAVPRLGIPAYDWWNEVLHGVARTPYPVTVFPQAIGMAATWDTNSLRRMADISATEGRAIHNIAIAGNKTGDRYLGLTYWTPNINIFRDPRWGRGQETYGEDPFLTGTLGRAFVRGLQGDDPRYLKAAACAKHFAVHSGPEPSRHSDNFNPSAYDLWDTYLPAFKTLVTQAHVAGVMCAYNAVNTQPCCANDLLLNNILRKQWNFTGYLVSDCWAVDDFFRYHKTHKNATAAAADALLHGTDIECGASVYKTLAEAVRTGLVPAAQIDLSLRRLFEIRFRLGMFDPPESVPYAQTPASVLESPAHKAHALKMAQQSVVLLKNQEQTLPLSKNLKKIAVIGPNADNTTALLGNYNGTPSQITSILEGIRQKLGTGTEIVYEKAINYTDDTLMVYEDITGLFSVAGSPGVQAEYYNNRNLEGSPVYSERVSNIDHYWNEGVAPAPGLSFSGYSVRYTTTFTADRDGEYIFETAGDDGYRILINDSVLFDTWKKYRWEPRLISWTARKGTSYKLVVEFNQDGGNAMIRLKSGRKSKTDFAALAAKLRDVDAIIVAGGISPQLEGEEMPVKIPGFKGGDRTSIQLPAVQTALLKALHATGKPVIFVMLTGSAIAIPWENENLPAILNAWYGGQSGGTAIADVLFGDYNPAGRLPVTFYKSDADLPDFSNYAMEGRTYRYFREDVLYPFGYGLSYTRFSYTELKAPASLKKGKPLQFTVRVTNTGGFDGDEVVQVYVTHGANVLKPVRALKAFRRITLKKGETQVLTFTLTTDDLSLVNNEGLLYQPDDTITISAGGGQPGLPAMQSASVLTHKISIR